MKIDHPLVSVILPTLCERDNIVPLIRDIQEQIQLPTEIIVVDDDSVDGTAKAVEKLIAKLKQKNVRLIVRKTNHGLTNSIKEGIIQAKGNIIVWMDADFSMPPKDIPRLLEKMSDGYDIVIASRFLPGGKTKIVESKSKESSIAVWLSTLLNQITRLLIRIPVTDFTSGFVAVKKNVFSKITLQGDYGEYFITFVVQANRKGFSIAEIPYICQPRYKGETKTGGSVWQLISRGRKYLGTIIRAVTS